MNPLITEISKELKISSDELVKLSLLAYLEHEFRLAEEDIADVRDKYFVVSAEELNKKIKKKEIPSHPAWEDLIAWENTETYIKKLKKRIERIKKEL